MEKTNAEIRMLMKVNDIRFWQLAEAVGVSDPTINRWFRHELEGEQRKRVEFALQKLIGERR